MGGEICSNTGCANYETYRKEKDAGTSEHPTCNKVSLLERRIELTIGPWGQAGENTSAYESGIAYLIGLIEEHSKLTHGSPDVATYFLNGLTENYDAIGVCPALQPKVKEMIWLLESFRDRLNQPPAKLSRSYSDDEPATVY